MQIWGVAILAHGDENWRGLCIAMGERLLAGADSKSKIHDAAVKGL